MVDTKSKIVEKSIVLFNQYGYSNVSLHQIAKELNLSSGNLTYHFPKKAALMDVVYSTFVNELKYLQTSLGVAGSFEEMLIELYEFIQLQDRFLFFYVDLLNIGRNYPAIARKHFDHVKDQIKRIKDYLDFNFSTGVIKSQFKEELTALSEAIWMVVVFYPSQSILRGKENSNLQLMDKVTSLLKPYIKEDYLHVIDNPLKNIIQL